MLDRNKHVQEAACSALATLEEQAGPELLPRLRVSSQHRKERICQHTLYL